MVSTIRLIHRHLPTRRQAGEITTRHLMASLYAQKLIWLTADEFGTA
jgi:hypothetical protein